MAQYYALEKIQSGEVIYRKLFKNLEDAQEVMKMQYLETLGNIDPENANYKRFQAHAYINLYLPDNPFGYNINFEWNIDEIETI